MGSRLEQKKAEKIEQIVERLRSKFSGKIASQLNSFVQQYYLRVAPADMDARSAEDLYGAVLAHWNFLLERPRGTPNIRVSNPDLEQHGWQSSHTIVEIIHPDMPFLVDSVRREMDRQDLTVHLIIHPVISVRRDRQGKLLELLPAAGEKSLEEQPPDVLVEALNHMEIDRQTEPRALADIQNGIKRVLSDLRAAVDDWPQMRQTMEQILSELEQQPPPIKPADLEEGKAFLQWLHDDHFTLLGYRSYELVKEGAQTQLRREPGSGLGILSFASQPSFSASFSNLPEGMRQAAIVPGLLIVNKASGISTVHRSVPMDYVGVKRFDSKGRVMGEHRFLGLFTAAAYNLSPNQIPLLRQKLSSALDRSGLRRGGHARKRLLNILESYPRDELFQSTEEELLHTSLEILQMQERKILRLFVRRDPFARFYSCIVFMPRDRYNTALRKSIQEVLLDAFRGTMVDFNVVLSESVLARIHLIVRNLERGDPKFSVEEIEEQLRTVTQSWQEGLRDALLDQFGEERGNTLLRRYSDAFPAGYREDWSVQTAALDVQHLEELQGPGELGMTFYHPLEEPVDHLHFKLYHRAEPLSLSDVLPMLENMGLRVLSERPYKLEPRKGTTLWIQEFSMLYTGGIELDPEQVSRIFRDAFGAIWRGEVENDGFNRLVLGAGMTHQETALLRAYCKYLLQTGSPFSQAYMERTLAENPRVACLMVALFHHRFNPNPQHATDSAERADQAMVANLEKELDAVPDLDQDRILHQFSSVLQATLRTNYFQTDQEGKPKPCLSFKLDPEQIIDLPKPLPRYEIFVYSPRVEGVHLRAGKVARGGIRWSDRREDFRTEILGLMKAQMVKNAVIVPLGAKGGFVAKQLPSGSRRDVVVREVEICYRLFIRGLLDLTDNLQNGKLLPPPQLMRYDDDDPYLVVAADRGTSTFSDIANSLAAECGNWLGDAFASGGSVGYDHKRMGITARGAWESVRRLFRDLGLNPDSDPFTVVGIGDMSGDVFGNGMLLSHQVKLVGAFDHGYILIDPDPDPEISFAERQRMFQLSRSTWLDYDRTLISPGGGIFQRSAKSVELTPQMQQLLDTTASHLTPDALIHTILRAQVDLLWNGGIGTYVRGSGERDSDVGDRSNDGIRVNGNQLRCKIAVEGGNLGFTQLGRIEYAATGGRISTDFIDNSGGVDCSDREVNIKILLNRIVASGDMTEKQRRLLLMEMTDDVVRLVLRDNYLQALSLSLMEYQSTTFLREQTSFMRHLEKQGELDRTLEFLPDNDELGERRTAGKGLTRPELAVLLAYGKIVLYQELLASDLPEDPYQAGELEAAFPARLARRFRKRFPEHPLRREIISSQIANNMLNRMGATFAFRLQSEIGATGAQIARAFIVARVLFELDDFWQEIEALDDQIPQELQFSMMLSSYVLVLRSTRRFLRAHPQTIDISTTVSRFAPGMKSFAEILPKLLTGEGKELRKKAIKALTRKGVPTGLANRVEVLDFLLSALDIVDMATIAQQPLESVGRIYFLLAEIMDLHWLRDRIAALPMDNQWRSLGRAALRDEIDHQQALLAISVLASHADAGKSAACISAWTRKREMELARWHDIVAALRAAPSYDFEMLTVAVREFRDLAKACAATEPDTGIII